MTTHTGPVAAARVSVARRDDDEDAARVKGRAGVDADARLSDGTRARAASVAADRATVNEAVDMALRIGRGRRGDGRGMRRAMHRASPTLCG